MNTTNILFIGVGGQGTILASTILTKGLIEAGYDVKMSEVHGMAQRGGSVSTQVRFGEKVYSPIFGEGEADIIVAFEKMEALRALPFLKPGGTVLVNDLELPSATVQSGDQQYPRNVLETLQGLADTRVVKATDAARELGNEKVMNVILFGALCNLLQIGLISWKAIIMQTVKPKFVDINLDAFEIGQKLIGA